MQEIGTFKLWCVKHNSMDQTEKFKICVILIAGAEIRAFDPRRVPTLNCRITRERETLHLGCGNESDCNKDLGVQCLRNELLDDILTSECSKTHEQAGKKNPYSWNMFISCSQLEN